MKNGYDISVVGSAYNEGKNIVELVERLQNVFNKKRFSGQIVLVDDASVDDTGKLMDDIASKYPNVAILHNEHNKGIAKSWAIGINAAEGRYVCLMDTDLQNLPEDVYNLYQEIKFSNADLVQGWRNHIGRTKHSAQYFLSRGLNAVLNLLFGMHQRDNKSGFVMARKEVMLDILKHRKRYNHFQTFITVAAHAKGYSIREVETIFAERRLGRSYLSGKLLLTSWQTFTDICRGFLEFRTGDWYDTSLQPYIAHVSEREDRPNIWHRLWHGLYVITYPLHHWMISRYAERYLRDMRKSQWLKPQEMKAYQEEKLRQLVVHSYYHVPFYREMFDSRGLKPEDIRTIKDLERLPIMDKGIVRENLHMGLLSNSHDKRRILRVTTSGSTGEPFTIYAEKKQLEMRAAATVRAMEWTGWRFGDSQVRLWHKHLGMKSSEVLKEQLDAFFMRRHFIPAYEISENNLGTFLEEVMRHKPVLLDGYAESYNIISQYLRKGGYKGHKPRGIISSGQTLPLQSRQRIEEAFGCKVYDKYGAREFAGGIAYQCSEQAENYHVVAECSIIEIVDKDGKAVRPGEMGTVLVTELNNYALPLIRFKLGDFAIAVDQNTACPCGRGLPLIGPIQGRIQATIVGADKQLIPGTFFARLFADYDYAIRQFQVEQYELGKVTLKIVKANRYTDDVLKRVLAEIHRHLGKDIEVSVEFVDVIHLGRTGKRHHSVSHLNISELVV
jgi:phenylacetate-CoA ligase